MKILLTGASGFLGNIMANRLRSQGHDLRTLGRGKNDDYKADFLLNFSIVLEEHFDIIIHCAGRAHRTPNTRDQQRAFFDVNVKGTINLINALKILPKAFVFISTVAVYGIERGHLISEGHPLLAKDPYGLTKIQAEAEIQAWCNKRQVKCAILRLPLVAGPNPPGNLKTMINGLRKGYYFNIDGGGARKSMVLAEDVAAIVLKAADIGGVYNLTDQCHPSFAELAQLIAVQLKKSKPANIPLWVAKIMAKVGSMIGEHAPLNTAKLRKITSDLTFDDTKAVQLLDWQPMSVLKGFKI